MWIEDGMASMMSKPDFVGTLLKRYEADPYENGLRKVLAFGLLNTLPWDRDMAWKSLRVLEGMQDDQAGYLRAWASIAARQPGASKLMEKALKTKGLLSWMRIVGKDYMRTMNPDTLRIDAQDTFCTQLLASRGLRRRPGY